MAAQKKKPKKHWYRIYVGGCPVCGKDKGFRERVYGKKPKSHRKRYVCLSDQETFDNCIY